MGVGELSFMKYLLGFPIIIIIIIIIITITIATIVEVGSKAFLEGTQWSWQCCFTQHALCLNLFSHPWLVVLTLKVEILRL